MEEFSNEHYIALGMMAVELYLTPKKVIFNNPATIVYWEDGSKTVVKCGSGDIYDREKGFAMCVLKRLYGSKFHAILKEYAPEEESDSENVFDRVVDKIFNELFNSDMFKLEDIKPATFQPKEN
mgnify:FL=1